MEAIKQLFEGLKKSMDNMEEIFMVHTQRPGVGVIHTLNEVFSDRKMIILHGAHLSVHDISTEMFDVDLVVIDDFDRISNQDLLDDIYESIRQTQGDTKLILVGNTDIVPDNIKARTHILNLA